MMKKKIGRPLEYKPEYCEMLIKHMEKGGTVKEFSENLGLTQSTINKWSSRYPEFSKAKDHGFYLSRMFNYRKAMENTD